MAHDDGRAGGIGDAVERREDGPLLTGRGRYTDDLVDGSTAHLAIVRSRFGHATLEAVDTSAAEAAEGVLGVYTGTDLERTDTPGVIPPGSSLFGLEDPEVPARAPTPLRAPDRPLLARGRVRYTGEPVAAVVAADRYAAHDAAAAVAVDYGRLDAVTHPEEAVGEDADQIHEVAPDNVAFDWEIGDRSAVEAALESADHRVEVEVDHQRVLPTTIEPRGAIGEFDPSAGHLTLRVGTQVPHTIRWLASTVLGLPEHDIRVVCPEAGGGFGGRSKFFPGELLAGWCAVRTGRRVAWQATRSEACRSDLHSRARTATGELAVDDSGEFRGLLVRSTADIGAYVSRAAPVTRTGSFVDVLSGQYRIPAIYCRVTGAFTNTSPVDSYRGSSRPQSILVLERVVDEAARELGVDPAELRRRNLVEPEAFPYRTPLGLTYDSGRYEGALDIALERVGYEGLREEQRAAREEGRYLGVGLSCVLDNAGSGTPESAQVRFLPSGGVLAHAGTADQGQGHRTAFAQLVADQLGVPLCDVEFREGDTDELPSGTGSFGSRSVVVGGEALRAACEEVVEAARRVAAHHLEADAADVAFEAGRFHVAGAPEQSLALQEVARRTYDGAVPDGVEAMLEATVSRTTRPTYPFGTHVAVVEVDPDTGAVDLRRYVAVDDCGVQLNPTLVEGQMVGGVVQGIGQALYEDAVYDEAGTLLTGSLQDYAVPRAADAPAVETDHTVTPSPFNRLGVKGAGESGATGAPAAVANAVADALAPLGATDVGLPATPERVWRAIEAGRSG